MCCCRFSSLEQVKVHLSQRNTTPSSCFDNLERQTSMGTTLSSKRKKKKGNDIFFLNFYTNRICQLNKYFRVPMNICWLSSDTQNFALLYDDQGVYSTNKTSLSCFRKKWLVGNVCHTAYCFPIVSSTMAVWTSHTLVMYEYVYGNNIQSIDISAIKLLLNRYHSISHLLAL